MKTIVKTNQSMEEKENLINDFTGRLISGEYKVILYNNHGAYTSEDIETLADIICYGLDDESTVESKNKNTLIVHTESETITLMGRKRMKDGEIILRKYLNEECLDGEIIIRDRLDQIEIEEENIKTIDDVFIRRCKDVVNIRMITDEDDPSYNNNWDCLLVRFKQNPLVEEVWQRC
ncbi:hypothetical protein [Clostridium beijerinckii]|uniref:hypothetical protein n=1 Tax=Clostridium beijerinckii TaxID=1520 RepID=UPI00098BD113|nr:hypothetical protein [Clostridium beijerinckii]NRT78141.1 hypothetical protein [Clostridium beijerinckii]OOM44779.1 hypothetical protein CBEIJ_35250 [Clostridium beijerinckii]